MKLSLKLFSAVLLSGALGSSALAQIATAPPSSPVESGKPAHAANPAKRYERHHEFANHFAEYLKSHPDIHGDLTSNPKLIHDKAYMKAHPDLREYLEKHPSVAGELREHPDHFMGRVNHIYNVP